MPRETTLGGNDFQDRRGRDIGREEGFDDRLDEKFPGRSTSFIGEEARACQGLFH